ncbi:MAG: hypothetical protein FWD57_15495 [Polyangiaceae bacterium]|nr:hypothetical protein [Polyangiaceae bacterium]
MRNNQCQSVWAAYRSTQRLLLRLPEESTRVPPQSHAIREGGLKGFPCYCAPVLRPLIIAAIFATAPMQCQGSDDPSLHRSEYPGEALYDLAQRFREKGDSEAYKSTLRYIIERYPSSRRAVTAQAELDALDSGSP